MVAMIGDETLKNTFNENTYIHGRNAPKSKEIFTKKISNCKKKWKQTSSFLLNEYCDDWFSSRETKTKILYLYGY